MKALKMKVKKLFKCGELIIGNGYWIWHDTCDQEILKINRTNENLQFELLLFYITFSFENKLGI
jgi:hypothetical protein